jgi:hypothetical protein
VNKQSLLRRFGTVNLRKIQLIPLQEEEMYEDEETPTVDSYFSNVERLGEGGFGFVL